MKSKLLSHFCLGIFSLLLVSNSFAQENEAQTLAPVTVVTSNINSNVISAFESSFKNAVNPMWYKIGEKFLVKFTESNLPHHACYHKNGALVYNITFGNEGTIPTDVKRLVTDNYYSYNIVAATNVQDNNRNVWVIKLEDQKRLVSVLVENDDVMEVSRLQKG
jgi:ABC-type Fe3+-hydroxamate transport system substrate-binding protein